MPSKKQEGKGDATERIQTDQLNNATSDETDGDGDNGGIKGDDPAGRATLGDVTIDVPAAELRRSNQLAGGTVSTAATRKSTAPPPVLKVHLESATSPSAVRRSSTLRMIYLLTASTRTERPARQSSTAWSIRSYSRCPSHFLTEMSRPR